MKRHALILTALIATSGCQSNSDAADQLPEGSVQITYQATVDGQGGCRPTYETITTLDAEGQPHNELYIMRGETEYFNAEKRKIGEIPFQVKMGKETQSVLNEVIACEDLTIKVTLEKCEYFYESNHTGCPDVMVKGQSGFAGIEFIGLQGE